MPFCETITWWSKQIPLFRVRHWNSGMKPGEGWVFFTWPSRGTPGCRWWHCCVCCWGDSCSRRSVSKRERDFETLILRSCKGTNPGFLLKMQRSVAVSIFVTQPPSECSTQLFLSVLNLLVKHVQYCRSGSDTFNAFYTHLFVVLYIVCITCRNAL